jgi:hypothetical protein
MLFLVFCFHIRQSHDLAMCFLLADGKAIFCRVLFIAHDKVITFLFSSLNFSTLHTHVPLHVKI